MATYDSREETERHIARVQVLLAQAQDNLEGRGDRHDASKLEEPEKPIFDKYTPLLQSTTYGTPQYRQYLDEMGVALQHHYAHNSHHPEHYKLGIIGMSLLDLIEMLADWKAASERHADGDFAASIHHNIARFGISPDLALCLWRTAQELGWLPEDAELELPGEPEPIYPQAAE